MSLTSHRAMPVLRNIAPGVQSPRLVRTGSSKWKRKNPEKKKSHDWSHKKLKKSPLVSPKQQSTRESFRAKYQAISPVSTFSRRGFFFVEKIPSLLLFLTNVNFSQIVN
jgi:hypothetical protein